MTTLQLPTPVPGYPLPDNTLALTPEEWVSKMYAEQNAAVAKQYVETLADDVTKASKTRILNTVMNFLNAEAARQAIAQA